MGKTVTALQIVTCPKCGRFGQLQRYKRVYQLYYRVTHYKSESIILKNTHWRGSGFKGQYDYCCYIGKEEP